MLGNESSQLVRFLRWSEKYTKTDMVYLARGGIWSIVGQVIAAVAALSVSVAFAHLVPKEVYGNYRFVLSVVGLLSILSLSSLGTAVAQSAARGYDGALPEGFKLNLRWSILIFLGALAVSAYYLFAGNMFLAFGILLGGCVTPFLNGVNLASPYLNGKQDFARSTLYFGGIGVIIPAMGLVTTIFFTNNLFIIVAVYFLSNLLIDTFLYFRTVEKYNVRQGKSDPGMFSYGKHLSVMGVISGTAGTIDQLLLFHFGGAVNLAVYVFSIGILDQIKGPGKALDKMIQARFSNRSSRQIEASMEHKMLWLLAFATAGVAIFYLVAPELYKTLFPAYTDAVPFARMYALTLLGFGVAPVGSYFAAHKMLREQYILNLSGSMIQIASMVIGVIFWGIWGLVVARVFSSMLNSSIMLVLYYRGK